MIMRNVALVVLALSTLLAACGDAKTEAKPEGSGSAKAAASAKASSAPAATATASAKKDDSGW